MSLRAMTKPAPTPPKPGCGGDAPATATERGRNRRSRPPRAFAREAALRLAGARVVCPAIGPPVRVADAKRGPVALDPTCLLAGKLHVRVNFGSILAGGKVEGQRDGLVYPSRA